MEMGTGYPGYNTLMPKSCGTHRRDPQAERLQHLLVRQEPQRARLAKQPGRALRPLADRSGVRIFLRLHRRRNRPVAPGACREHPSRSSRRTTIRPTSWTVTWPTTPSPGFASSTPWRPTSRSSPTTCPGSTHAPHHAPKEWIAKFKGQFDQGWDKVREETLERQKKLGVVPAGTKLTPRPKEIPAWDSLNADQKRLYAHMMEVYAGALAHCDYHIGRVVRRGRASRASSTTP